MAEVTYFVALPFVAADDGIAAGEPTECFNPIAVVMRAEALSRKPGHVGAVAFSRTGGSRHQRFRLCKCHQEVRRRAERPKYIVEEQTMAEDDDTATARYIASNVSTQLMLKTPFEIIVTMAGDPDRYRSGMRKKLLALADTMRLVTMATAREMEIRVFVKETVGNLLMASGPTASPPPVSGATPFSRLVSPKDGLRRPARTEG
jgi:hypothetical protein